MYASKSTRLNGHRIASPCTRLSKRVRAMQVQTRIDMLSSRDRQRIADKALDWAYMNGLVVRSPSGVGCIHVPIAALPSPFPASSFEKVQLDSIDIAENVEQAIEVMPLMNTLYDAVSRDQEFLISTLKAASELDEFTAKLLEIYSAIHTENFKREEITLAINRSDYMLDGQTGRLLQVELNTIASSFGCLSSQTTKLHKYLISTTGVPGYEMDRLPDNSAMSDIADALACAHKAFNRPDSVILTVVLKGETNRYDQQWLALLLSANYGIEVIRRNLTKIEEDSTLDGDGNLVIDGKTTSVVYFRSGYDPRFYPTLKEWEARERIEMSTAVKCPSINYHLTGTKKVQQELAKPGRLENYLNEKECSIVREFFAGLWALDTPESSGIIKEALENPERFVLKPQREGGGNNLYGAEAAKVLSRGAGLGTYILMERIRPEVHRSLLLKNEATTVEDTVSELGVYGTFVKKGDEVLMNGSAGHLLRTKVASADEGGVAAGFAVIDSPYLT